MIILPNTKYGSKRKAIIAGFSQWDNLSKNATVLFYVQIMDNNNVVLDDLSINQNRAVFYTLNNDNRVNAAFNPIESGGTGEYDYFFNMASNPPVKQGSTDKMTIIDILISLGDKLNERGIFD